MHTPGPVYESGLAYHCGVSVSSHPILQSLTSPVFRRILAFTDQAILVLNHSTSQYDFVSDNITNLVGFSAADFIEKGGEFAEGLVHPSDLEFLKRVVYPAYSRCLAMIAPLEGTETKFSHTCRLRKADGTYSQFLHQSVPLSFENDQVLISLLVVTDISMFKKDSTIAYRAIQFEKSGRTRVLAACSSGNSMFSEREIEVLAMTAQGLTEKQIADRLSLSIFTIKTHRKNMFRKARVKNSAELVRYGIANLSI